MSGGAARGPYFGLALALVAADQATKLAAHGWLRAAVSVEIVPGFFNLTYSRNRGGLFGYFGDVAEPWRQLLLTGLPLVAIALLVLFLARGAELPRRSRAALALILGGAVGNLIDRVTRGEVVDFLDVYVSAPTVAGWLERHFGTAHWPTFNVADSAIVVGAGLMLLDLLFPAREAAARGDAATGEVRD